MSAEVLMRAVSETSVVGRAVVVEISAAGEVRVEMDDDSRRVVYCDVLEQPALGALPLQAGDSVLVHTDDRERGCVLGRIGPCRDPMPRTMELKAHDELTIRCGEGSIKIKKNGKVLIKGLHVVSHAKGRNRIRGGSIQLN